MNHATPEQMLTLVTCGAGPAVAAGTFVHLAQHRGWAVQVVATPAALDFFDQAAIEKLTGKPVKSQYSGPGAPRSRVPDAVIVAPATYNTINKWALGISDTYALGVLAEMTGLDVPIVVLPFVNSALAGRAPFSAVSPRSAPRACISCSAPVDSDRTRRVPVAISSTATPGISPWMKPAACSTANPADAFGLIT